MGNRLLPRVSHPEFLGNLMTLLARYADDVADKNDLDRAIVGLFEHQPKGRDIARRLVDNFNRTPAKKRARMFGAAADVSRAPVPPATLRANLARHTNPAAIAVPALVPVRMARTVVHDDVGDPIVPPYDPRQIFTLNYTGFYCREETDWDGFSDSDEMYAVTTVVQVRGGENIVRTEKHPLTQDHYGDVDHGEFVFGPVAACWDGRATDITLITSVFEKDGGDPNAYRDEIEGFVRAALYAAQLAGYDTDDVPPEVVEFICDALNWVLGASDDLIETRYLVMSSAAIRISADNPVRPYTDYIGGVPKKQTNVEHHFYTEHRGGGATYIILYKWSTRVGPPVRQRPDVPLRELLAVS